MAEDCPLCADPVSMCPNATHVHGELAKVREELEGERNRRRILARHNQRHVAQLDELLAAVKEQADNEGLWFEARTMPEAYLQQELRRLHALIEGDYAVARRIRS